MFGLPTNDTIIVYQYEACIEKADGLGLYLELSGFDDFDDGIPTFVLWEKGEDHQPVTDKDPYLRTDRLDAITTFLVGYERGITGERMSPEDIKKPVKAPILHLVQPKEKGNGLQPPKS